MERPAGHVSICASAALPSSKEEARAGLVKAEATRQAAISARAKARPFGWSLRPVVKDFIILEAFPESRILVYLDGKEIPWLVGQGQVLSGICTKFEQRVPFYRIPNL
jgi:hypothetical protein